jgi:hypothetical protein
MMPLDEDDHPCRQKDGFSVHNVEVQAPSECQQPKALSISPRLKRNLTGDLGSKQDWQVS